MLKLKLILSYDGTDFFGFQENGSGRTVEGVLKGALFHIFQTPLQVQGASRTDRGVHARGQVVDVLIPKRVPDLQYHLNRLLPKDVVVTSLEEVLQTFHATLDAKGKEYHYNVSFGVFQSPFERRTHWHFPIREIARGALEEAIALLLATKDFSAFTPRKKREEYSDCNRSLSRLEVVFHEDSFRIEMVGSAFLYHMARILSGTLSFVACGRLKNLKVNDRTLLGVTVPPHGLLLHQVFY